LTEHTDKVLKQKEILNKEKEEESINFIEVRFEDSKWTTETTGYKSGKVVTKYNDKRKKDKIEYEI
tara:strand:+ start:249 stop:446 length:198 start_codon:yes stop_codon:yes gene_type:complete